MEEQPAALVDDLDVHLDSLSQDASEMSFRDFEKLLIDTGAISAAQWRRIATCAAGQLGRWESAWLFSPFHAPDSSAIAEFEGWRQIWAISYETLLEQSPELQAELVGEQRLQSLKNTRRRRDAYNRTKPAEGFVATLYSQTAYVVNKLGFNAQAVQLYAKYLYPQGTVGRTSACGK